MTTAENIMTIRDTGARLSECNSQCDEDERDQDWTTGATRWNFVDGSAISCDGSEWRIVETD